MLRNPIHLFRRDGILVSNPLFSARFFPKSTEVTRKLNYGVAMRHLLFNNLISTVPSECLKIYHKSFFERQWFNFRAESGLEGSRIKVISNHSNQNTVIRAKTRRKLDSIVNKIRQEYISDRGDILFIANDSVYFSSDSLIENYLIDSLHKGESLTHFPKWFNRPPYRENEYHLLLDSCSSQQLRKATEILLDDLANNKSLIYVIDTQDLCKPLTKKTMQKVNARTISLKRYAREKQIFGCFYRFLSDFYSDILSINQKMEDLPLILEFFKVNL